MPQRYIRFEVVFLVMALVVILATVALANLAHGKGFAPTPLPYSCDTVRAAAKLMTPAQMNAAAKEFGVHVTSSQIREARKCLAR